MTTQSEAAPDKSFVRAHLPWIAAALMGVIYLLTVNHWLSFKDLRPIERATGQAWTPETVSPVFNLVTSPFRWLPETSVPIAFNLFSVLCATLVLALLARSVALLPQDRTAKQREREQSEFALLSGPLAWIPPVLAVTVYGLQLTFWENATNLSADIFALLLFAYSVRCLFEYRVSRNESWLLRAALIYALSMTETWVAIALVPAFLGAVIWIKGLEFFRLRFVARFFLCGLVGLLFYFYLPAINLRSEGLFWQTLKSNAGQEFNIALSLYRNAPHYVQFLMALTSLLPIFVVGIRWKSSFGDTSHIGAALTTLIFHLTHAILLLLCIWAAFDTGFSLRDPEQKFSFFVYHRDKLLPLYFLGALSIGYFSGYFLLVFRPLATRSRRTPKALKLLNPVSVGAVCTLLVLAPAGLLYKNIPQIRMTNGPAFQQFASALTETLPTHGILLSDNEGLLVLAEAWLARTGKATDFVFLNTRSLKIPAYHRFQQKRHPKLWPPLTPVMSRDDFRFTDFALTDLLAKLSANEKNPLLYLHPSFGAHFEYFYAIPHGLVYELKQYPTNTVTSPPALSETVFAENETFWKNQASVFLQLLPAVTPPSRVQKPTLRQQWMQRMHIPFEKNPIASAIGANYSHALNTWGAYAQRLGRLESAGKHFQEAISLYQDNVVAAANLEFNKKLRAGEHISVEGLDQFEEHFGKFQGWEQILDANGLFDDVTGCLAQGIVFARGNLNRQAAQQFERVLTLAPDSLLGRLWLARVYLVSYTHEKALPLINDLKARSDSLSDAAITQGDVFRLELSAYYANQMRDDAQRLLQSALSHKPVDTNYLESALQISVAFHQYTNALTVLNKQLEVNPNSAGTLLNKGFLLMQLGRFDEALPPLTQVLTADPKNFSALLYRGYANLQTGKLDESMRDYEAARALDSKAYPVYYGIGEIYRLKKDTNNAVQYYELAISNSIPNSAQARELTERLKKLKAGTL